MFSVNRQASIKIFKDRNSFFRGAPDCTFNSGWMTKFCQLLLRKGQKSKTEIFVYSLFKKLKLSFGIQPYYIFYDFIISHKMVVELRSYRKSNIFYEVPFPVSAIRQYSLSLRWLTALVKQKKNKTEFFRKFILSEFLNFLVVKTNSLKKHKADLLESVAKSRAYQHYRW